MRGILVLLMVKCVAGLPICSTQDVFSLLGVAMQPSWSNCTTALNEPEGAISELVQFKNAAQLKQLCATKVCLDNIDTVYQDMPNCMTSDGINLHNATKFTSKILCSTLESSLLTHNGGYCNSLDRTVISFISTQKPVDEDCLASIGSNGTSLSALIPTHPSAPICTSTACKAYINSAYAHLPNCILNTSTQTINPKEAINQAFSTFCSQKIISSSSKSYAAAWIAFVVLPVLFQLPRKRMIRSSVPCVGCQRLYFPVSLPIHQKTCFHKNPFVDVPCPTCKLIISTGNYFNHVSNCVPQPTPQAPCKPLSAGLLGPIEEDGRIKCMKCRRGFAPVSYRLVIFVVFNGMQERIQKHQSICQEREKIEVVKDNQHNSVQDRGRTNVTKKAKYPKTTFSRPKILLKPTPQVMSLNTMPQLQPYKRAPFDLVLRDASNQNGFKSTGIDTSNRTSMGNPLHIMK
ncbi:hypothetical protein THRCLA_09277 [Thraustotheca clavata]|uniref:Secreted protein n=1 Tax=Thraustotheca clavata TaxID=74557 RepID=A0A1V9YYE8_9STRA|nr:hypothetical protein THRCLA_09277 [Thraustotheca clavata]